MTVKKTEVEITPDQLMELVTKLKAENDALNNALKKARPNAGGVSVRDNGQVVLSVPSGKGAIPVAAYPWHWNFILGDGGKAVAAFLKENKKTLLTQEEWAARKAAEKASK